MSPIRSISSFAVLVLAFGCSSEIGTPNGEPNPGSSTPSVSTGVPGPGQSPQQPVTTAGPPAGPATPGTSNTASPTAAPDATVPPPPAQSGDLTEEDGYTPVLNADGSIARPMALDATPTFTRFARLTNTQWQRSVQQLLALPELPVEESQFFENIGAGATDFVNDQSRLQMSNTQWGQFQGAAEKLATRVAESDDAIQRIYPGTDAEAFVRDFGRRAFRRPLLDNEVDRYLEVFATGSALSGAQSDFTKGAGLVIETMLQSPHFLYRTELGAPGTPISGYEAAAKLSLYILGIAPSDELLDKAERGQLDTVDGVAAEAEAMLETEAAAATFHEFHTELFELHRFKDMDKSDPSFTPAVAEELVEASEAFFERIYTGNHGVREILTTRTGFVGPATAQFYGLTLAPSGLQETQLPEERAGFFTQLPYLMYFARDLQSYGILRGVHLNTEVLCVKLPLLGIPAPPLPDIEFTTSRDYMEKGTTCGGTCHSEYINNLGFSMENFDGMGRVRETDNGYPVDTTGDYPFVGGMQQFQDAVDLMQQIAENEMAHECYSRYIASYGLGRMLSEEDRGLVESLAEHSMNEDASTKELVLALIRSPEFNTRGGADQ